MGGWFVGWLVCWLARWLFRCFVGSRFVFLVGPVWLGGWFVWLSGWLVVCVVVVCFVGWLGVCLVGCLVHLLCG